jgi:hypothetical protein
MANEAGTRREGANELVGAVRRSPWALRRRGPLAVMLLIPRGVRARFSREGGDRARRPGLPSRADTRSRTRLGSRIRTTIEMRADDGCVLAVSAYPIMCATGSTLILISLMTPRSTRPFTQSIAAAPKASRATIRMGTSNGIDGSSSSTISHALQAVWCWRAGEPLAVETILSEGFPAVMIGRPFFLINGVTRHDAALSSRRGTRAPARAQRPSRVKRSLHRLSVRFRILPVARPSVRSEEECPMPTYNQQPDRVRQEPGPGRSTSGVAFNELRKEIAQRNEQARQEARKRRTAREREQLRRRREHDV